MLDTVGSDLRGFHRQLDNCKITGQVDKMLVIQLMTKQGTHARLLMEAVDHMRQAELAMAEMQIVKE